MNLDTYVPDIPKIFIYLDTYDPDVPKFFVYLDTYDSDVPKLFIYPDTCVPDGSKIFVYPYDRLPDIPKFWRYPDTCASASTTRLRSDDTYASDVPNFFGSKIVNFQLLNNKSGTFFSLEYTGFEVNRKKQALKKL